MTGSDISLVTSGEELPHVDSRCYHCSKGQENLITTLHTKIAKALLVLTLPDIPLLVIFLPQSFKRQLPTSIQSRNHQ